MLKREQKKTIRVVWPHKKTHTFFSIIPTVKLFGDKKHIVTLGLYGKKSLDVKIKARLSGRQMPNPG
jgi:hypothetical protein